MSDADEGEDVETFPCRICGVTGHCLYKDDTCNKCLVVGRDGIPAFGRAVRTFVIENHVAHVAEHARSILRALQVGVDIVAATRISDLQTAIDWLEGVAIHEARR